ncbi:MAG: recombination regulator RecX [Cytophagales bacterium]|nr:recombination regulator RecX [Cytophagales bacterium]
MSFDKPSLKGRALRCLAVREYSRFELEQKLKAFEEVAGELQAALDDLEAKGFISEARVVESTLNQKASRFGAARVLHTLKAKGIDAGAIVDAAEQLKETEFDRAMQVWTRKFDEPYTTPSEYAKQARFLASRGFSGEVVGRVMRASKSV